MMAIRKAYEISCDGCGSGEPVHGNRRELEAHGWIFVGEKHFCSTECAKKCSKPNDTHERLTKEKTEKRRTNTTIRRSNGRL